MLRAAMRMAVPAHQLLQKVAATVASAELDQVNIRKDRLFLDFVGVHDGVMNTESGPIRFDSDQASYDEVSSQLRFEAGVRVQNEDFNLTVPKMTLDRATENIQAPGPISGTLKGGKVSAWNVKYKFADKGFFQIQVGDPAARLILVRVMRDG